jgi:hypothetical protein
MLPLPFISRIERQDIYAYSKSQRQQISNPSIDYRNMKTTTVVGKTYYNFHKLCHGTTKISHKKATTAVHNNSVMSSACRIPSN